MVGTATISRTQKSIIHPIFSPPFRDSTVRPLNTAEHKACQCLPRKILKGIQRM